MRVVYRRVSDDLPMCADRLPTGADDLPIGAGCLPMTTGNLPIGAVCNPGGEIVKKVLPPGICLAPKNN